MFVCEREREEREREGARREREREREGWELTRERNQARNEVRE